MRASQPPNVETAFISTSSVNDHGELSNISSQVPVHKYGMRYCLPYPKASRYSSIDLQLIALRCVLFCFYTAGYLLALARDSVRLALYSTSASTPYA